jgi:hypothetical protein
LKGLDLLSNLPSAEALGYTLLSRSAGLEFFGWRLSSAATTLTMVI